jgi:mannose-6-phosphate isomerase-like protein (cupin superfamily)
MIAIGAKYQIAFGETQDCVVALEASFAHRANWRNRRENKITHFRADGSPRRSVQQAADLQRQNFEAHNIPPGAVEKVAARRVYPVMAPADYQGRSAGAPVKGPRGLIVSIAECEPGNGPGLHRHLNTVENFCCLSGRFEIAWGDQGEHTLVLEPLDMISVPRGENRSFRNISNELGRLLVMIVPETDEQVDPISYAPSLAKEIEKEYGKTAVDGLQKIGFKFEDESGA